MRVALYVLAAILAVAMVAALVPWLVGGRPGDGPDRHPRP